MTLDRSPSSSDARIRADHGPSNGPLSRVLDLLRRAVGLFLIAVVAFPVYRLLAGRETGLAGEGTVAFGDTTYSLIWSGMLVVAIPALICARVVDVRALERRLARLGDRLAGFHGLRFALLWAAIGGALTAAFTLFVVDGKPNLIDAMSQLVQARYMAEGRLAGPVSPFGAFWHIQNTLVVPNGWVSHFPPGHTVLLALGFRVGAVWLVPALLMATTVFFTSLAADRLFSDRRWIARTATVLVAVNPFLIGLAGVYMNHITAAAFAMTGLYFALRARDGRWSWAVLCGAAFATAFSARPLSGLVLAAVTLVGIWILASPGRRLPWLAARFAAGLVGALPPGLAVAAYNLHFFGSPFRFGYDAALGPAVRLGFGRDPWGNVYGPVEALAYTASDLLALSLQLFETPVPVAALVGAFLLFARRLSGAERFVAALALAPVLALAFYWHHDLFMGPRMLNEFAPAWVLLTVVAAAGLVSRAPAALPRPDGPYSLRAALVAAIAAGILLGWVYLLPQTVYAYGTGFRASTRTPAPRTDEPSLVFVHGAWTGRIAMTLAATGMRLDSVEMAMRLNPTCDVHRYTMTLGGSSKAGGAGVPADLDFTPRARNLPPRIELSPDSWIIPGPDHALKGDCAREARSDRYGVIDVSPLLWQGDLPGLTVRGAMYVRDLGPEANRRLIESMPDRKPLLYMIPEPDGEPVLVGYEDGMARLWGEAGSVHDLAEPPDSVSRTEAVGAPRRLDMLSQDALQPDSHRGYP